MGLSIVNDVPAQIGLQVLCQANTERLYVIEVEKTGDLQRIVTLRDSATVAGAARSSWNFNSSPVRSKTNQSVLQCELVAEHRSGQFSFGKSFELKPSTVQPNLPTAANFVLSKVIYKQHRSRQVWNRQRCGLYVDQSKGQANCHHSMQLCLCYQSAPFAWGVYANGKLCAPVRLLKETGDLNISDLALGRRRDCNAGASVQGRADDRFLRSGLHRHQDRRISRAGHRSSGFLGPR